MNTPVQQTIYIDQAKTLSKLSGMPIHAYDDVWVWGEYVVDTATALVAAGVGLCNVPLKKKTIEQVGQRYRARFENDPVCSQHMYPLEINGVKKGVTLGSLYLGYIHKQIKEHNVRDGKGIIIRLHAA